MTKKNIALVTGGYSGEAVISYKSAESILKNLDTELWNVYLVDIHPSGWFHPLANGEKIFIDKNDFSLTINHQKIKFDAVLVALHGTPGEDGKLQGYFDCLGIPYTSCDAATSALTFNTVSYTHLDVYKRQPQCAAVCPVDCCVPDEEYVETVEQLMAKKEVLHS